MSSIYPRQDGPRGPIRKRKEPQPWDPPLKPLSAKSAHPAHVASPAQVAQAANKSTEPDNKLLAGFLAHEFLTKGTLLGKRFEPGKMDLNPVQEARSLKARNIYKEVSYLLKADGVHIPGVFNPSQLETWLQK